MKMTYKLVPPEDNQRNLAKKLIGTFKDHFIGVLSGCAKSMPMHLWCQLLSQVEWRLLLLQRQSRVKPGTSAYAHVYQGQHDYNKHPFVPIRMELLVHVKLHKQQTYAQHCNKGSGHWHIIQALPMSKGLDEGHTCHASIRGGMIQTQISNQPIHHPRRPNCSSHRQTGKDPDHWSAAATKHQHSG